MKLKKGYRPWVARKAPLFTHSLNETYIKASALLPIVIISALIGGVIGITNGHRLTEFNKAEPAVEIKSKNEAAKPVAPSINANIVEAPVLVPIDNNHPPSNTVEVPAIPMNTSQNGKLNQNINLK